MSHLNDFDRLVRLDERIAQLERDYSNACEAEMQRGGKHFLLSRSLEHSLKVFKRKRENLERILVRPVSQGRTFSIILEKKKAEAIEVEDKIQSTLSKLQGVGMSIIVSPDNKEYKRNYSRLSQELIRLEKRLAVKEAAIEKWLGVEVDNIKPIVKAKIVFEREYEEPRTYREYKNPLENDPRWNSDLNTKVIIEPQPTQNNELASPGSTAERIEIKLEEKEQLDDPTFSEQKKRILIE